MARNEHKIDHALRKQADDQLSGRRGHEDIFPISDEFKPTYKGRRHEHAWLLASLGPLHQQGWIADILRSVKGGKEASVYLCAADPAVGVEWLAAKVYRPRIFRNLRNDAIYKEGRDSLDEQGKPIRDQRRRRAIERKTRFGKKLEITSWIEREYETITTLYEAGADIPRPYIQMENTILMEFVGDGRTGAPALQTVTLDPEAAARLYRQILDNIELMLSCNRVHGDLSAYNVLYWEGNIKIIDFPQVVDARFNPHAMGIFLRDVERICQYFARYGLGDNSAELAIDLWTRHQLGPW